MTTLDMSFLGLPWHPLVIHLVVVALPVGALATVAAVAAPRVRERWGLLALGTLTVGAMAAVPAAVSGNALAAEVTRPQQHAVWGQATMVVSLVAAVAGWLWWWMERRRARGPRGTGDLGAILSSGLVVIAALASVVLVALAGHSGAQAVWGTPEAAASSAAYTLDEVAHHADASSCWAVVDGGVYDLTTWADAHPGGRARILALCGTDATEQFSLQHGTGGRAASQLASLRIGELA